jgi:hypothetical protein
VAKLCYLPLDRCMSEREMPTLASEGTGGGGQARYLTPLHRFLEKYQNREKKETCNSNSLKNYIAILNTSEFNNLNVSSVRL